jgi:capsid portal protein
MGNAYIEVGRSKDGNISYIGHVSPIHIRIRKKRDGFVQMVKGKTVFFRNFGDDKTKDPINGDSNPNELIHIARYSPIDDYYGVPESTSTITAMAGMKFAEQYNIDFFENKAVPRYIIKSRGLILGDAEQNELLKFFEANLKGQPHRSLYIPVPAGNDKDIDFVPVETGKQDGHFLQYIRDSTQFILSRHRVPQARIGLSSAATSQAESREAEKTFKETVCQPEQRNLEYYFNKIVKELTDLFLFELKEYSLSDEDTQSMIDERYLRWGVVSPDDIRGRMDLGPRPDGRGSEAQDMLSIAVKQAELALEAQKQAAKDSLAAAKVQAKAAEQQQANNPNAVAPKPAGGSPAQAKAENRSQQYQNRTRDQNRNANNPRKNPNNRDGQRSAGEGKPANKR